MSNNPLPLNNQTDPREFLKRCVEYHGHLCTGQALGVRIALKGLELAAPGPKDLIVFVENDRCIANAIQIVTGTRLGRRSMKLRDYGKMAASFLNLSTGKAFRVSVKGIQSKSDDTDSMVKAVMDAPDSDLLKWEEVKISIKEEELPGKPKRVVKCSICGEKVFDFKDIESGSGPICRACAKEPYYKGI